MTKNSAKGSVRNICQNLIPQRLRLAGIQATLTFWKWPSVDTSWNSSQLSDDSFGMPITVANPEKWTIGSFYSCNSLQPSRYKLYVMLKVRSLRLAIIAWAEMSRNDVAGGLLYYIPLRQ